MWLVEIQADHTAVSATYRAACSRREVVFPMLLDLVHSMIVRPPQVALRSPISSTIRVLKNDDSSLPSCNR